MLARRPWLLSATAAILVALAGCERKPTKAEILKKAEAVKTRADLEKALGKADEVDKVGPAQRWTYKASDGSVTFMIVADRVVLDVTGGKSK